MNPVSSPPVWISTRTGRMSWSRMTTLPSDAVRSPFQLQWSARSCPSISKKKACCRVREGRSSGAPRGWRASRGPIRSCQIHHFGFGRPIAEMCVPRYWPLMRASWKIARSLSNLSAG